MSIIAYFTIGILAGYFVRRIIESPILGPYGYPFIGIIGATVGGFSFYAFQIPGESPAIDLVMAAGGALLFLMVAGLFEEIERSDGSLRKS